MERLTIQDVVLRFQQLGLNTPYRYFSSRASLEITDISSPEGPIRLRRWSPDKPEDKKFAGISTNQIATIASVFSGKPNYPIHFDRLFSAGGNSRSALETLLALTPNFFYCYPQKINPYTGKIEKKLKHLIWAPKDTHAIGEFAQIEYDQIITEVEFGVDYGEIGNISSDNETVFENIESKKTHTQMQVALIEIGNAMNLNTWIARNDHQISVGDTKLGDLPGVIKSLDQVDILYSMKIRQTANLIDCIWFTKDYKYIPAVLEIEHSTGVTSGLTRMLKFRESYPSVVTSFAIVAANELRNKVVSECNQPVFESLQSRFFAYSTVRELFGLIRRYPLAGKLDRTFVEPFLERIVS